MEKSVIRTRLLKSLVYPMSSYEASIQARLSPMTAKNHLTYLYDVGSVHTSENERGIIIFHLADLKHPSLFNHKSKIEEQEKKSEPEIPKTNIDMPEGIQLLDDTPAGLDVPGDVEHAECIVGKNKRDDNHD